MSALVFGNQAMAVELWEAYFGVAPSNPIYNNLLNTISTSGAQSLSIAIANQFSGLTDAQFGAQILANLDINSTTVNATSLATLQSALANYLHAVTPASRGTVVMQLIQILVNLGSDPTFGAAANAFNDTAFSAFTYSSNAANLVSSSIPNPPVTIALTLGVDNFVLGAGNDTFIGNNADNSLLTLTSLDSINGGSGNNTLNITLTGDLDTTTAVGTTIANIQNVNLTAAGFITADTTAWVGTNTLNSHSIDGALLTAAATTDVTAVDLTHNSFNDGTEVDGGHNVTITESADSNGNGNDVFAEGTAGTLTITQNTNGEVIVGDSTAVTGAVNVSSTDHGFVRIEGGTTVNVAATGGTVIIGSTTAPTGAVNVADTLVGQTGFSVGFGSIIVNGGTTVAVTETATQPLPTPVPGDTFSPTTFEGSVFVNGNSLTTAVTVNQTASVFPVDNVTAVAGVTEADSETFVALTAGQTLIVDGLTFTAGAAGTTAAQTAAAFANLTAKSIQGNSTLGTYQGAYAGHFTTGAVTPGATTATASVVFTSATANSVQAAPVFTGTAAVPAATQVAIGAPATAAVAGVGGIEAGIVQIVDANGDSATAAGTITTVVVNGSSNVGGPSFVESNALSSLSLANDDVGSVFFVDINAAAPHSSTLALTVNHLAAGSSVNLDDMSAAIKTLNITTAGKDSAANITGTIVTALTVAGTNAIDLTGSSLGAVKTVAVSGAAGVTAAVSAALTDFNASATSGNVTVTGFDATLATYEGGSGVDTLTLTTVNPTKAISMGAGDDTLTLFGFTTAPTAIIDGGAGTDVLGMFVGAAASASATTAFASKVVNFETLGLGGAEGAATAIDLAVLGGYNTVADNTTDAFTLTLNNMASGGTLVLRASTGPADDVVNITGAATGTSDSLNLVIKHAGAAAAGTVTAAGVESIHIAANDTTVPVVGHVADSLTLVDAAATTIVVTGNAHLTLTSANHAVTTVDASGMNGGLTYTTAGTVAETVTGGAASNSLTAGAGTVADTLIGGAGNDTLTANAGLDILTGGAGRDVFVIQTPSANLNSYATITDAAAGDTIQMGALGVDVFAAAKITLAATAVFQDFANAAINAGGDSSANGHISWFQFAGDTYVVESVHNAVTTHDFQNGTDLIVKLTGLVDLSHTSLDTTLATLLIG